MRPAPLRRLLAPLLAATLALAGCQTDLPLVDLKEKYGAPPSRFLPMDGIEVHWRDEGPGAAGVVHLGNGVEQHARVRVARLIEQGVLVGQLDQAAEVHHPNLVADVAHHRQVV